ncbi:hypothetical protein K505DRAFT_326309 [Melanomma pulvis-pyrius CBS 109.77]|uniref:Ubiquitin-conjugating enzyme E2-binding protein n=1 Tax=Melanomma pulvis-pyrius CBS 109.77 TaxID=1314802 RepID=A0A6A6X8A9_9PLEO|nr:hypothetical protein K505DRAFT_326309 [Melanomma pulvis-pyrius CBS 109.77]
MPPSTLPASAYEALELPTDTVKVLTKPKPTERAPTAASPNLLQSEPVQGQPLALNESAITLYAELLLHIRTVTLFASLRSFHTHETKAQLAADGSSITVSHEGESATIRLPIKVQGGGDAALSLPAQPPSKDLTLRLQMEEKEGTDFLGGVRAEERKTNIVPWDGASLNAMKHVELLCKACHGILLRKGTIGEWRDLPNENWAEMMDFWHCHKPDEHHLHDHIHEAAVEKKGYAAGNRLQAVAGVGFVDIVSLLLKEQDCEGVQLLSDHPSQTTSLVCKTCTHILGTQDPSTSGWRIWKWSIGVISPPKPNPTTYSIQKWISARLLFLIENTGVRKFHVHPEISPSSSSDAAPIPSLLLWVFTPDLLFSSSLPSPSPSTPRRDPTRAMKVFYQHQTFALPKAGEQESASIEDVEFPGGLYEELERGLRESGGLLPVSARQFQGWEVGLLERFDVGETDRGGNGGGGIEEGGEVIEKDDGGS